MKPVIELNVPDTDPLTVTHDGSDTNGKILYAIEGPTLTSLDLLAFAHAIVDRFGKDHSAVDVASRLREMRG